MADDWASGVLPHTPLTQLAPDLWQTTGSIKGMPLPRNMVVARLPDGRLLLHSVVAMNDEEMAKLDALGEVAFLVVPGPGHRIDISRYHARYPNAKVLAPAASRAKIEEVCPVDATCEDALRDVVGVHAIPGLPLELAYEVQAGAGRALILNDVLGRFQPQPGLTGWIFGQLGTPGGKLGLARIVRFRQVKDRAAVHDWVEGLSRRDDLTTVTLSHGEPVTSSVSAELRDALPRV
jgi:hypothetical protein